MKKLDRLYFTIHDRLLGLAKGYDCIQEEGYSKGWDEGFDNGVVSSRKAVINKIEEKNLNASDESFQLGYLHALAIAKGEVR